VFAPHLTYGVSLAGLDREAPNAEGHWRSPDRLHFRAAADYKDD
jgi:hypothetical protein